jgi:hypothetical protein
MNTEVLVDINLLKKLYVNYIKTKMQITSYDPKAIEYEKKGWGRCLGGFYDCIFWDEKVLISLPLETLQKIYNENI